MARQAGHMAARLSAVNASGGCFAVHSGPPREAHGDKLLEHLDFAALMIMYRSI